MVLARALVGEEKVFCQTLGTVVMFWNHIEASFRTLLQYAARGDGPPNIGDRIDVLIANLGNVSMAEAMEAISEDFDPPTSGHLKHCAELFDALRLYRNYYVHAAISFATTVDEQQTVAIMQQVTAKGGSLKLHQGSVKRSELETFENRLSEFHTYVTAILIALIGVPDVQPFSSLGKPPLPDKLELRRLRLIEHRRQLRS